VKISCQGVLKKQRIKSLQENVEGFGLNLLCPHIVCLFIPAVIYAHFSDEVISKYGVGVANFVLVALWLPVK
jgi:hypothetical protein